MEKELRINPQGEEEIIELRISPSWCPKAYEAYIDEHVRSGMTREEAEDYAYEPIPFEVYYEPGQGLFLVESEAVDSTDIFSPYTKTRYKSPMEDLYFVVEGEETKKWKQIEGFERHSLGSPMADVYMIEKEWANRNMKEFQEKQ